MRSLLPSFGVAAAEIRPEAALILSCARTRMGPEQAERIRALLRQDLDWADVFLTAFRHGVVPLLYWNLHTTCPEGVPPDTLADLQDHFNANARRSDHLARELLGLLELLDAHGIPAVPFKGPVLAASVYGSPALRKAGDLDLLIGKRGASRARDLLLRQGYRLETPLAANGFPSQPGKFEYRFERDEDHLIVELRWQITPEHWGRSLDFDLVWESRQPVSLAGGNVPSLPTEETLLILCMHGSKHRWSGLMWICDVAELLRACPGLRWRRSLEHARRLGCGRMVSLGLLLARDLLGASLPQVILHHVQSDCGIQSLASDLRAQLFSEAGPFPDARARVGYQLRLAERLSDRVRFRILRVRKRMVPTSRDRALMSLPVSFSWLYYLIRPIRLAADCGKAVCRCFRQVFGGKVTLR